MLISRDSSVTAPLPSPTDSVVVMVVGVGEGHSHGESVCTTPAPVKWACIKPPARPDSAYLPSPTNRIR